MMTYYVHPTAVVDDGAQIGDHTKIWHFSHIMGQAIIGTHCTLGQNAFVANNVTIGNGVKIQNNVSIYEGVILEDYVFCGPSMVFTNVKNPRAAFPVASTEAYATTRVGYGATIGANATVVCGVTIGRWAFIGAGAVVTRDVPPYALMVGTPAKQIGWACECGERLHVAGTTTTCQNCNRQYEQQADEIRRIDP